MNIGDKVTIYVERGRADEAPTGVTTVVEVSARFVTTADGRRWKTKGYDRPEVDKRGREHGHYKIRVYRDKDERRVERQKLVDGAARFVNSGYQWEILRDLPLLSDADLASLGEIGERLKIARQNQRTNALAAEGDDADEESA